MVCKERYFLASDTPRYGIAEDLLLFVIPILPNL